MSATTTAAASPAFAPAAYANAVPHFKTRGFIGQHTLERCEDPGCRVAAGGHAECGRVACPSCGFSGSNLTLPDALEGLVRCTCGHVFEAGLEQRAA
jgi:hypothetical protein